MSRIFNTIPVYYGRKEENLALWLKKIETAFALDETPLDSRLDQVVVKLDGIAGEWYSNHRELWSSWSEFKRAIQARFQVTLSSRTLWLKLLQLQQEKMNIREYIDDFYCKYNEYLRVWRLEQELKQTTEVTPSRETSTEIKAMVKDAFIDGLDERIKFIILQANPEKLEDAISAASRLYGMEPSEKN